MFHMNEKIILIASSHNKKIGPCKNSVGYIVPFLNSMVILKDVAFMPANVRFLHYGNEKRERFETKQILITFPILRSINDDQIKRFIYLINNNKYIESWDKGHTILHAFDKLPAVLAVPIRTPEISLVKCSNQEFFCWFENHIMSPQMSSFINNALSSHNFFRDDESAITKETLLLIQTLMVDRGIRQETLGYVYKDVIEREKWIKILRIITITVEFTHMKNNIDWLSHISNNKGAYNSLMPYVFYHIFPMLKDKYIKCLSTHAGRLAARKKIKMMEDIKDILFTLTH